MRQRGPALLVQNCVHTDFQSYFFLGATWPFKRLGNRVGHISPDMSGVSRFFVQDTFIAGLSKYMNFSVACAPRDCLDIRLYGAIWT